MEKNGGNNTSLFKYFLILLTCTTVIYFLFFYKDNPPESSTDDCINPKVKTEDNNTAEDIQTSLVGCEQTLEEDTHVLQSEKTDATEEHVVRPTVSSDVSAEIKNNTPSATTNKKTYDDYDYDVTDKNIIFSIEKTKYINRILIVKTSNILMWHFLNGGLYQDYGFYLYNNDQGKTKGLLNFSTSCYVFEVMFRFLSFSYISKTNRRYGMYWKVHLFDNYSGYHNFNEKCTRGLLGFYIGFYYNYIKTKNFKIGFYIGIGTMIQRFYGLCFKNRVVGYSIESNKAINKMQFYNNDSIRSYKTNMMSKEAKQPFFLLEILTNPLSYYNTDIIGDVGIFNLEHKNGFCFNINWKLGIVNTYLILKKYYTSFKQAREKEARNAWGKNPLLQATKYFIIYNLSISCGLDLNKKCKNTNKYNQNKFS